MKKGTGALPKNRFEQFWSILRYHTFEVVFASNLTLLFLIPLIAWLGFTSNVEIFQENTMANILLVYGILAVTIGVGGIGVSGGLYFFKKLLFGEGVELNQDFFKGIKENWKRGFADFFLIGIFYLLLHLLSGALALGYFSNGYNIFFLGVSYAFFFILSMVFLFHLVIGIFFDGKFLIQLWSSFRFVLATLYKGIGIFAVILIPFIVYEFVPYRLADYLDIVFVAVIHAGLSELLLIQFANHIFDQSVNKKDFPQNYRKGLYIETGEHEIGEEAGKK